MKSIYNIHIYNRLRVTRPYLNRNNKTHSTSNNPYAITTLYSLYLRNHYPLFFINSYHYVDQQHSE